jgi:hypothetical protein
MSRNPSSGVSFRKRDELEQLSLILQHIAWARSQSPPPPETETEEEEFMTDKYDSPNPEEDIPSLLAREGEEANPIFSTHEVEEGNDGLNEGGESGLVERREEEGDGLVERRGEERVGEFQNEADGGNLFFPDVWETEEVLEPHRQRHLFAEFSSPSPNVRRERCAGGWMVLDSVAIFIWFLFFHMTLLIVFNEIYCCVHEDGVSSKRDWAVPYCPSPELCLEMYVMPGMRGID